MIIKGLDNIIAHLITEKEKNVEEWCKRKGLSPFMTRAVKKEYLRNEDMSWGENQVSEHDEDYVFDALFDVPNR